jgi:hypothetical protein
LHCACPQIFKGYMNYDELPEEEKEAAEEK